MIGKQTCAASSSAQRKTSADVVKKSYHYWKWRIMLMHISCWVLQTTIVIIFFVNFGTSLRNFAHYIFTRKQLLSKIIVTAMRCCSVLFLLSFQFHPPVLEPDFYLPFSQVQSLRYDNPASPWEIGIPVELPLQLHCLKPAVRLSASAPLTSVTWWHNTLYVMNISKTEWVSGC